MKKYLSFAMMALAFTACQKDDNYSPEQNGEVETSYLAVTLASADMGTRAVGDAGNYEEGLDDERIVKRASFFFFFQDGSPFPVTANGSNWLDITVGNGPEEESENQNMPNVSDIKKQVLVIQNYKGQLPEKVVAILNWQDIPDENLSISDLKERLVAYGNATDGFIMSNSVYMDGDNNEVYAKDLTVDNFKHSSTAAQANPVSIYVERLAAKVVLTTSQDNNEKRFALKNSDNGVLMVGTTQVYGQVLGWDLYNDYPTTTMLKVIDKTWQDENLGFQWNYANYFRSYWATPRADAMADNFNWDSTYPAHMYCGENTGANRTKLVVKVQLQQQNGGSFEPLAYSQWFGNEYVSKEALLIAVQNSLNKTYYSSSDGNTFTSIDDTDLDILPGTEVTGGNAYDTHFKLSTTGLTKTWYKKTGTNTYEPVGTTDDMNTILLGLETALYYPDGQTYYFTDIKHLDEPAFSGEAGLYGIVRNHVYKVKINSITGFGTPVLNVDYITTPELPEQVSSFLSADINILSWRIVSNDVDL